MKLCLTWDIMNLTILYKLTYNFVGGLLHHAHDDLYCLWSNALLRYMWTIVPLLFDQHKNVFKYPKVRYVFIYIIQVPVYHCDFSKLEWNWVPTFGIICLCLSQFLWCLIWMGVSLLSVQSLCNWYVFCMYYIWC